MLYAKFGCNWFTGSREESKYVQKCTNDERRTRQTTSDDGQKQIAIVHLSNSGDIKIHIFANKWKRTYNVKENKVDTS